VPWASACSTGSQNHGLKNADALTKLVDLGPKALPYLLEALEDKTPTKLTIEHGGGFGGMWYGERPAIRWVAGQAYRIRDLAKEGVKEQEIAESVGVPLEFIAVAKSRKFPDFIPQAYRGFHPRANARERRLLEGVWQEFAEQAPEPAKGKNDDESIQIGSDIFTSSIREYTVTVGDVCFVIIGQITNRTYLAAQYQPTACVYIISPTHDPKIAADVRAIWSSDDPTQMLYNSLRSDWDSAHADSSYDEGALLRLGYYYPQQTENLLLDLLPQFEAADKSEHIEFEQLEAIMGSKSQKVQERIFRLLQSTSNMTCFWILQQAFGPEHDPLVLKRTLSLIDALPEDGDAQLVLGLLIDRFPSEAKPICRQFVESPNLHRKDGVINALWSSSLAPELLKPLLDDKRPFGHYTAGDRVCDRAAQAISNNLPESEFDSEWSEATRDKQIYKIKLQCIGIGVRKTEAGGSEPKP
jgi:hypothetical protein